MTAQCQLKVVEAGFTIIRMEKGPSLRIKFKGAGLMNATKSCYEWKTLEKGFPSMAAMERRFSELLKDKMTIAD